MKTNPQLELIPAGPLTLELSGAELIGLEDRLAIEGKRIISFQPIGARWLVEVGHCPVGCARNGQGEGTPQ